MAKSKGKAKSKKGSGKDALPKTVAGVKVPKAVRKSSSIGTLLSSGLGREILADALVAAAGAAAAALTRTRAAREAGSAVADAGSTAASATGDAVQTAAGAVASVVTEAARTFLPPSLVGGTHEDEKPRDASAASDLSSRRPTAGKGAAKQVRKASKKGGIQ
jgi:hypothetical protein